MSITKGMILAAGVGSRLGVHTDQIPKPMIEIRQKPILQHNVEFLAKHGICQLIMNVHYQPEMITGHFQDGGRWGVSIHYSHEEQLLGTAGALQRVAERLSDTFVLVYGDNLHSCDLTAALAQHRRTGAMATMTVFERKDPLSSGIVAIDENDRITRILEKPKDESQVFSHWVNAGLLILDREVLEFVPPHPPSDMVRDVLPALLRAGQAVYGYRMAKGPIWIDTPEDLEWARKRNAERTPMVSASGR
jgi:NDP-sugar pyrophosphorylase family protein